MASVILDIFKVIYLKKKQKKQNNLAFSIIGSQMVFISILGLLTRSTWPNIKIPTDDIERPFTGKTKAFKQNRILSCFYTYC